MVSSGTAHPAAALLPGPPAERWQVGSTAIRERWRITRTGASPRVVCYRARLVKAVSRGSVTELAR